jgi:hypothetical protein
MAVNINPNSSYSQMNAFLKMAVVTPLPFNKESDAEGKATLTNLQKQYKHLNTPLGPLQGPGKGQCK